MSVNDKNNPPIVVCENNTQYIKPKIEEINFDQIILGAATNIQETNNGYYNS